MDCRLLSSRTSFSAYVELVRNATNENFSLVEDCRAEVCGALWGSGNPDVSGIGMAVGYLLEGIISLIIVCTFTWLDERSPKQPKLARTLLLNASRAFYDNAAFFACAIQVASIARLTKVDFGISADGMGALTMEIVWLVSTLTLLPLLPLMLRSQMYRDDLGSQPDSNDSVLEATPICECGGRMTSVGGNANDRTIAINDARQDLRFLFFVICWAMAFYPFFSRMGGTFGTS